MNKINKNISMFFQEFGSLNLEMAIIIAVLVIAAVAGLATTGGKVNNSFTAAADNVKKFTTSVTVVAKDSNNKPIPDLQVSLVENQNPVGQLIGEQKALAGTAFTAKTNENGVAEFKKVPVETYNIVISDRNYVPINGTNANRVAATIATKATEAGSSTIKLKEAAPETILNIKNSRVGNNLNLLWQEPEFGALPKEYEIQVATNENFADATSSKITASSTQLSTVIPIGSTEKFVRIRSIAANGLISEWSPTVSGNNVGASFTQNGNQLTIKTINSREDWTISLYGSDNPSGAISTTTANQVISVPAGTIEKTFTIPSEFLRYRVKVNSSAAGIYTKYWYSGNSLNGTWITTNTAAYNRSGYELDNYNVEMRIGNDVYYAPLEHSSTAFRANLVFNTTKTYPAGTKLMFKNLSVEVSAPLLTTIYPGKQTFRFYTENDYATDEWDAWNNISWGKNYSDAGGDIVLLTNQSITDNSSFTVVR